MSGSTEKPKTRFSCLRVLGCLTVILGLPVIFWWYASMGSEYPTPPMASCIRNLKQLSLAMQMYAQDYDETLPRVHDWAEMTMPYMNNPMPYHCPDAADEPWLSYGMSRRLSGKAIPGVSEVHARREVEFAEEVMLFDGRVSMAIERHDDGANYSFTDGHVKWYADPPEGILVLSVDEQR